MAKMINLTIIFTFVLLTFVCGSQADNITEPTEELYNVSSASQPNLYCILMQAGIRLHFNYTDDNNKTQYIYRDVPKGTNDTTTGTCGNITQTLQLQFNDTKLTFSFNETGKDGKNVALTSVAYEFTDAFLIGLKSNETYKAMVTNLTMFEYKSGKGFLCNSNTSIDFDAAKSPLVHIETIKLRVEAFRTEVNNTLFDSDYSQCVADNSISNIVPIAVGAALGALVLVVLVAYLVGRKRNQRGYETV